MRLDDPSLDSTDSRDRDALIVEAVRLKLGITVFGQRDYESKQVSALAWGALSIGLCVLIAPKAGNWDAAYRTRTG